MKNLKRFVALSFMTITALFVGCSDDNTGGGEGSAPVVFPEAVSISATVGGSYTLTFDAAQLWSITTDASWIEFRDGSDLYSSISGTAADGVEVTFEVSDKEMGFSDSEATITLLMDGEMAVIANVTRSGNEASIAFYSLDYSTYEEYEIEAGDTLEIAWNENNMGFITKLHFVANFDWRIEGLPDWILNSTSYPIATEGGASDEFSHVFSTNYSAYTDVEMMEATINIVGQDDSSISFPLTLTTRGAKDLMVVTWSDSYDAFSFDADGTFGSSLDGSSSSSYDFSYVAATVNSDNPIYVISCQADGNGGYTFSSDSSWAESWVWIDYSESSEYDESGVASTSEDEDIYYGDYLVHSYRKVEVGANSGDDARAAVIIVLPTAMQTTYQNVSDFYNADGSLKGELESYVVGYVEQKGASGSMLEFAWTPYVSATIETIDESWGDYYWFYYSEFSVPSTSIYALTYATSGSAQINFPYTFDWESDNLFSGQISGSGTWLSVEPGETYFTVSMNSSEAAEGYVILQQGGINVVAIHCVQSAK